MKCFIAILLLNIIISDQVSGSGKSKTLTKDDDDYELAISLQALATDPSFTEEDLKWIIATTTSSQQSPEKEKKKLGVSKQPAKEKEQSSSGAFPPKMTPSTATTLTVPSKPSLLPKKKQEDKKLTLASSFNELCKFDIWSSGGICDPSGLANLGNTCYMGSALQVLFAIGPLTNYFLSGSFKLHLSGKDTVTEAYYKVLESFYYGTGIGNRHKSVLNNFMKAFISKLKTQGFTDASREDSEEFLRLLFNIFSEELNRSKSTSQTTGVKPELLESEKKRSKSEHVRENFSKTPNSIIDYLFQFQLRNYLTCTKCEKTRTTFETTNILSIGIDSKDGISLQTYLKNYSLPRLLSEADKVLCESCKQKTQHTSQVLFWNLPDVFMIHLKRIDVFGRYLNAEVPYPFLLDMKPYMTQAPIKSPHLYDLIAVNYYEPVLEISGHFVTSSYHIFDQSWYKYDDVQCLPKERPEIDLVHGYILVYKKRE